MTGPCRSRLPLVLRPGAARAEGASRPRRVARLLLLALALLLAGPGCSSDRAGPADLVLRGGAVCTMSPQRPWARALAVRDGRIVFVGDDNGVKAWIGPGTTVHELDGKMVLPGFHDSHVHPVEGGIELGQCVLSGLADAEHVYDEVRRYADDALQGRLTGRGTAFRQACCGRV